MNILTRVLGVVFSGYFGVSQADEMSFPSLTPTEIQIVNSTNSNVSFLINGDKCSPPIAVSLNAGYQGSYTCPDASSWWFSVSTQLNDQTIVQRNGTLLPGSRNFIYLGSDGAFNITATGVR